MKKIIGIMFLSVLLFAGCDFFESLTNPIIGTWETTIVGITVTATFNADDTCTETNSLGQLGISRSGTWTSDSAVLTLTWEDESEDEYAYSFNSNKSEMTLVPQPIGVSITYYRQ